MKKYFSVVAIFAFLLIGIPGIILVKSAAQSMDSMSISDFIGDSSSDSKNQSSQSESDAPDNDEDDSSNNSSSTAQPDSSSQALHTNADSQYDAADSYLVLDITTGQVSEVSIRDYVIGAVCAEMPATFHEEALKAQAVAAHTYAERQMLRELDNPTPELMGAYFSNDSSKYQAYFTENQAKQFFGDNYEVYYSKIESAVDKVLNQILIYDDVPIIAAFHSLSSGMTESAQNVWGSAVDYLVPVESPDDVSAPKYLEEYNFSADDVKSRLVSAYPDIILPDDASDWISVEQRSDSNTVIQLIAGNKSISGTSFQDLFSLRSACFDIEYADNSFKITTKGYGHGVGMSQYGANFMANNGNTYDEILEHYYIGAQLISLS